MITAKYNHAIADVALSSVSTEVKSAVMEILPAQKFGGFKILDSVKPFSKTGVYIKGELAGDTAAAGSGSLEVYLYSADTADGTMAKVATFGPFTIADINAKGEFLNVALPENAKGCIQIGVKGSNLTAGKVRIRVEA